MQVDTEENHESLSKDSWKDGRCSKYRGGCLPLHQSVLLLSDESCHLSEWQDL